MSETPRAVCLSRAPLCVARQLAEEIIMTHKVCYGIPSYGGQEGSWWAPQIQSAALLHRDGIELRGVLRMSTMMVDVSRNHIVDMFMQSDAEWLKWIDADNVEQPGSLKRLLNCQKTIVSGVYVKRNEEKPEPIVYTRNEWGRYDLLENWTPGEILPLDAAGMGACLVHRSVFEDIQKNYRMLDLATGGIRLFHKDDIVGDIFDETIDENDGKVINGVHQQRVRIPNQDKVFSYFILGDGRTEDYGFFECAKRSGHQLWIDTAVEAGHIGETIHEPKDWRAWQRNNAS